jgi:hypothetical protein
MDQRENGGKITRKRMKSQRLSHGKNLLMLSVNTIFLKE